MHARLSDTPALKAAAQLHRRRLIDVRTPPHNIPIANGRKRSGMRLLTVGTDCALRGHCRIPSYAGVSLGLLHGSQPDVIVVCHEPGRTHVIGHPELPMPTVEYTIDLNLTMGRRTNPAIRCGGVSFNTSRFSDAEARRLMADGVAASGPAGGRSASGRRRVRAAARQLPAGSAVMQRFAMNVIGLAALLVASASFAAPPADLDRYERVG
jgi:uncharacterized NAD-dependent epimerase/dehydratase family protein